MNGCETGDMREVRSSSSNQATYIFGNPAIVSDIKRSGAYSIRCAGGEAFTLDNAVIANRGRWKLGIRISALPAQDTLIWQMENAFPVENNFAHGDYRLWLRTTGQLSWEQIAGHGPGYIDTSANALIPGGGPQQGFHCLEWRIKPDENVGDPSGMTLRLDGVTQWDHYAAGLASPYVNAGRFITLGPIGPQNEANPQDGEITMWFDDWAQSLPSGDIWIGLGGIIARQGSGAVSGWDQWEKVNASTASAAWSDTPPNEATACQTATGGLVQRMPIHAFSTPQVGHGSDVIISDAIVGAWVKALVSHPGDLGGGTQVGIGHVVGGSLGTTGAAIGATASIVTEGSGGLSGGVWTAPLSELDTMEVEMGIGALSGSGPIIVHDVWVMAEGPLVFASLPPPTIAAVQTASPRTGECREGASL